MEMPIQLLRLLLNKDFFDSHQSSISREMFPDKVAPLYDTITKAHEKYQRDVTTQELKQLYLMMHPTATRAMKDAILDIVQEAEEAEDNLGPDVAGDILQSVFKAELGRKIADLGLKLNEGDPQALDELRALLDQDYTKGFAPNDNYDEVSDDVLEVLAQSGAEPRWKFNLPPLAARLPGFDEGNLMGILARPEMGKTAFIVSLMAKRGGFADQGAKVAYFGNEEPVIRTRLRCMSAFTGMSVDEIRAAPDLAKDAYKPILGRIKMYDAVGLTSSQLKAYCRKERPDIVIVDQMDKVVVDGSADKETDRLRKVWLQARELAKSKDTKCAVIGMSQASYEAEGKTRVTFAMAENSKTGKGAETDIWLGIGKRPSDDQSIDNDPLRYLTLSKNKVSGFHGTVTCMIVPHLSQYVE